MLAIGRYGELLPGLGGRGGVGSKHSDVFLTSVSPIDSEVHDSFIQ